MGRLHYGWNGKRNNERPQEPEEHAPAPGPLEFHPALRSLDEGRFILGVDSLRGSIDETRLGVACVKGDHPNADFVLVNEKLTIGGRSYKLLGAFDGLTVSAAPLLGSKMVAEEFNRPADEVDIGEYFTRRFKLANAQLISRIDSSGFLPQTTASVGVFDPQSRNLDIGHAGDTRIYSVAGGKVV